MFDAAAIAHNTLNLHIKYLWTRFCMYRQLADMLACVPPVLIRRSRYYARGVFAWPLITSSWSLGGGSGMRSSVGKLKAKVWDLNTVALSLMDWPLRWGS